LAKVLLTHSRFGLDNDRAAALLPLDYYPQSLTKHEADAS